MEKLEIKNKLIELCKINLQERADNAKIAMEEMQQSANEYGTPRDRYDSFRAQALRKKDLFAEQYQRALDDLVILKKIDLKKRSEKVEFGSVVISNKQKMIVSVSLGKILLETDTYYAVSPQVPLYKAMQGLKKDDKFEFNEISFEILDIF